MKNVLLVLLGVALAISLIPLVQRLSAQSTTTPATTRILIPFIPQGVQTTAFVTVTNAGKDPYGTASTAGSCTVDAYGGGTHYGPVPFPNLNEGGMPLFAGEVYTDQLSFIFPGTTAANTLPNGGNYYFILTCNFPFAHAAGLFINSVNIQGTSINNAGEVFVPGYIIPPNRSFSTGPEQLLQ